jgi:AraC-like DNA-binding protein
MQNLERMLTELAADCYGLTECHIAPGWRVSLPPIGVCALCYTSGEPGKMSVGKSTAIPFPPHSLAVIPAGGHLWLKGPAGTGLRTLEVSHSAFAGPQSDVLQEPIIAGAGDRTTDVVYIPFRANWGITLDLFGSLQAPLLTEFGGDAAVGDAIGAAVAEFREPRFGSGAMCAALTKQLIIMMLRRSLDANDHWPQRLAILQDRPISRVFAEMVAFPGAQYSVTALSLKAGLSRSAFMARFVAALGAPPMVILRDLRMKRAAELFGAKSMTTSQIARAVGYRSRSSFARAFRQAHSDDPSGQRVIE